MEAILTALRKEVSIPVEKDIELQGVLVIPDHAQSLVIFSHGSGSSRLSPRNNMVSDVLNEEGIGTLLFDLLTPQEDAKYETRFDIELLTNRLLGATSWIIEQPEIKNLKIGYFGASTGAASALNAAAILSDVVKAIVCRGGRPDLSMPVLERVKSPVLLIVGGYDDLVLRLNQKAFNKLKCKKELQIIPQASHLFEEPGKLEAVAKFSAAWFDKHLN